MATSPTGVELATKYPMRPGNHSVNKATTTVSLAEGQVSRLQYYAPWTLLVAGKLGPPAAAA
jgi:hypothetical protein